MTRHVFLAVLALGCSAPARPHPVTKIELGDSHVLATAPAAEVTMVSPPPDPQLLLHDLPELALRWSTMIRELDHALAGAGTDCHAALDQVNALRVRYMTVTDAVEAVIADQRGPQLHVELAPYAAQLDASKRAIAASAPVTRCADAGLPAALDKLLEATP